MRAFASSFWPSTPLSRPLPLYRHGRAAFKFLFEVTLQRPWPRLDLLRPRPTQTLPLILSVNEVWHILDHIDHPTYYTCLANIRKLADLKLRLALQPR